MTGFRWLIALAGLLIGCSDAEPDRVGTTLVDGPWFTAWAAPHHAREAPEGLSDSTVRMLVRPSVSGETLKIKLENTVGRAPVTFSAAFIGVSEGGGAVVAATSRQLTFGGRPDLTLAPGAGAWSDPLPFAVEARQQLAVSLDVESAADASTHTLGLVTNYRGPGRRANDPSAAGLVPVEPIAAGTLVRAFPVYWVAALDVAAPGLRGGIVAFGDSLIDGRCSTTTPDLTVQPDLHQRWTDLLALRLAALPRVRHRALANEGIVGNRVVIPGGNGPTAVDRLERDVLERTGTTHVIFFEGTNDIFANATAEQLIGGMQQVIDRLRAARLKVIGATLLPRGKPVAVTYPPLGFSAAHEAVRQEVNRWIRAPGTFDAIIDFESLLTGGGPAESGAEMLKPEFNCDYIHPNAAGYAAMAELIDLSLFDL
jgi:lysophospholipase L1-like esterase